MSREDQYVNPRGARCVAVASYAEQWMALRPWRESTRDATASGLRRILPVFGDRPIGSLRTSELQAWAIGLEARLSPATVEGRGASSQGPSQSSCGRWPRSRSPAPAVKLRRRDGSMLIPLTVHELQKLAGAARPVLRAAVILAACTGVRQSELFGLTADRVMWLRREFVVDRQLVTPEAERRRLGRARRRGPFVRCR